MRQLATVSMLVAAGSLLGACGLPHSFIASVPRSVSLADRCADTMKAAFPSAEIDIGKRTSETTDSGTMIARVEGIRIDLPADGPVARDLAVECRFDDSILSGFHWIKGGPRHSSPVP
jgi:hypothetical protein